MQIKLDKIKKFNFTIIISNSKSLISRNKLSIEEIVPHEWSITIHKQRKLKVCMIQLQTQNKSNKQDQDQEYSWHMTDSCLNFHLTPCSSKSFTFTLIWFKFGFNQGPVWILANLPLTISTNNRINKWKVYPVQKCKTQCN